MANVCFMSCKDDTTCGEDRGFCQLVALAECREEMRLHLNRIHLARENIEEHTLILARAGFFNLSETMLKEMWVCPKHRSILGRHWRPDSKTTCQYPDHKGKKQRVTEARIVGLQLAEDIHKVFGIVIPVGSPICNSCRKRHNGKLKDEWKWLRTGLHSAQSEYCAKPQPAPVRKSKAQAQKAISEYSMSSPLPLKTRGQLQDVLWTPGQSLPDAANHLQDKGTLKSYNEALAEIASLSGNTFVEPLIFQLKGEVENATQSQSAECVERVDEACHAVCSVIAPNDSDGLLQTFIKAKSNPISGDLDALVTAYKNAPSRNLKTQILSIYAYQYSAAQLKTIHEPFEKLSERQIKNARTHARNVGEGLTVEKTRGHRTRIDLVKLEHFLSFVDQPYFHQDVAYGTKTLKLDSGEELVMPNVVRTVTRSTMIQQYFQHCKEENVTPLGRSTLYRILQVREASQRKSLKGLDNTAAGGAEGFETLHKVVDMLEEAGSSKAWCKETKTNLKNGKRYLKTEYRAHCREEESNCADHCRQFAMSDPKDACFMTSCKHDHNSKCGSCENLRNTIQNIQKEIDSPSVKLYSSDQKGDIKYDVNRARDLILEWKAHIIRSEQQDRAKQDLLESLENDSAVIVMDWAMKFLQLQYREKQSEWYGKRGMNWHVSCIISRRSEDNSLEVLSYVHIFNSCAQDWYSVCAILENLFKIIVTGRPNIKRVFLRSDCAGCYHNNKLIAAAFDVGERLGIKVCQYDFSEPQHGKDICDRIISPIKGAIRRYCNEGNDILSASDMYEALKARQVKGSTAAVCELGENEDEIEVTNISQFSTYHNFNYEKKGIRVFKAYNTGSGKLIPWSKVKVKNQGPTTLEELSDHSFYQVDARPARRRLCRNEESFFHCQEAGCSQSFTNFSDFEDHIQLGKHDSIQAFTKNIYDKIRCDWVAKFSSLTIESKCAIPESEVETDTSQIHASSPLNMGWALQKTKGGGSRFSENVKEFLTEKFHIGAKTGRKCDPIQVAAQMRTESNLDGTRKFTREEWLTKTQIKGFFSRLNLARKRACTPQDITDQDLEEEKALEDYKQRREVTDDVMREIELSHPIIYDVYNICDYAKGKKLAIFTVSMLKEICCYFDISYKSRDTKPVLIEKVEAITQDCTCFK